VAAGGGQKHGAVGDAVTVDDNGTAAAATFAGIVEAVVERSITAAITLTDGGHRDQLDIVAIVLQADAEGRYGGALLVVAIGSLVDDGCCRCRKSVLHE